MGCGISRRTRKREFSSALALKIHISLEHTTSNLTSALSRSSTFKSLKCLKLKLPSSSSKLLKSSFNLMGSSLSVMSLKYLPDYKFIQDLHTKYLSLSRQFMTVVHEVCINNFSIKDGIFLMLVLMHSHSAVKVKLSSKVPFVTFVGELENETASVFKAWKELLELFLSVSGPLALKIEKSTARIMDFLNILHEGLENEVRIRKINRAVFLCQEAINAVHEVVGNSRKNFEMILEFFKGVDKKIWEIKELAEKCEDLEKISAEAVVHRILTNNI